jgi:hypothetical protein
VIIDNPLLVGDKFHACPLRPLLEIVNARCNKLYREYKLRDAIRVSFKMREGVEYGRYLERVGYRFKPKGTIEKFYADYGVEYVW